MDKTAILKKELKKFKKEVSKKIPITEMIFFGSRAKGKGKRDSDIDLIIVSEKFKRKKFHQRSVKLYDLWKIKHPVDFLCYTPKEFQEEKKKITIVREAVKEGIKI